MFLKRKAPLVVAVLGLSLAFVGCSDDEPPEEPVAPTAAEAPLEPPPEEPAPVEEPPAAFSPENVYFAFDDYSLNSESQSKLTALAEALKTNSSVVQVEGHCDERGSVEYNLALGERRATSVKNFLVNLGVEDNRLTTISYGEEKPSTEGHDEGAWSQNRRAEFVITAQ